MKLLNLITTIVVIFSCSKQSEIIKEEKNNPEILFSVEDRGSITLNGTLLKDIYFAKTENKSFEFEIIDGNGGYITKIQENCKVTIDGNSVKVELLDQYSLLTITDKHNKSQSIRIESLNEILNYNVSYSISSDLSQKHSIINHIDFGVGNYSVENLSGNSAEIEVDDNDVLHITALNGGTSYFDIIDERGMRRDLCVSISITYNVGSNYIKVSSDQTVKIKFNHDEQWRIDDGKQDYDCDDFEFIVMHKASKYDKEHDYLQISTAKESFGITGIIRVVDKNDNKAYIGINTLGGF